MITKYKNTKKYSTYQVFNNKIQQTERSDQRTCQTIDGRHSEN
jgi:hypothetical protein